jgi:hypothetical protein
LCLLLQNILLLLYILKALIILILTFIYIQKYIIFLIKFREI